MADASEVEKSLIEAVDNVIKYNEELKKRGVTKSETSEEKQKEETEK